MLHNAPELPEPEGIELLRRKVSREEIIYLTSQLAIMVDTGINLSLALEGLAEQADNPALRTVLIHLRAGVEGGKDFSAALAQYPQYFDRTYLALVRASERTGMLGAMLEQIAGHLSKEADHRRKVRMAMAYPAFMLLLAISVTVFLLTYVMPKFQPLFQRKGMQLPLPTQIVVTSSEILIHYWWAWTAAGIAGTIALLLGRRTSRGRLTLDWVQLHAPLVGRTVRKVILARSIRTLGIMIKSNVPALEAIRLCSDVCNNVYFERSWQRVIDELTHGKRICEALRDDPLFPKTLVQMIGSGEETGRLAYVLDKVSGHYEQEVDAALKGTTSLIEPVMVTIMGVVVGGIGMAVLLPIFTLSRSAG